MTLESYKNKLHLFQSFDELKQSPVYELVKNEPLTKSGFFSWVHRSQLQKNEYNPNKVADPELELLLISIIEDGWTQPIVGIILESQSDVLTIIDGYHRYFTSDRKELQLRHHGFIPVVLLEGKNKSDLMMATIRHNRARGQHQVLRMADIIQQMVDDGLTVNEIMNRLQMEQEEVKRLAIRAGISKSELIYKHEFSKAYIPRKTK